MKSAQAFFIKVALFFSSYAPLFALAGLVLAMLIDRPAK